MRGTLIAAGGGGAVGISDIRKDVADAIENARAHLDQALVDLDRVPAFDPGAVSFVAHAMSNYMNVTDAMLGLLKSALWDHPDREVQTWLDGIQHVSELTHQTVARLLRVYDPSEIPLKFEYAQIDVMMERACNYHRRGADQKQIALECRTVGDVPRAWVDRVAVAVIADTLLSNAVKFSHAGGRIDVVIMPGPGGVVTTVRDSGPGLTPLAQARLFERGDPSDADGGASVFMANGHGLLVAKAFVDRMRGRLWSESEPEKGAWFSFRLPYSPPHGFQDR
jgi:signal transduction histidine kinase